MRIHICIAHFHVRTAGNCKEICARAMWMTWSELGTWSGKGEVYWVQWRWNCAALLQEAHLLYSAFPRVKWMERWDETLEVQETVSVRLYGGLLSEQQEQWILQIVGRICTLTMSLYEYVQCIFHILKPVISGSMCMSHQTHWTWSTWDERIKGWSWF